MRQRTTRFQPHRTKLEKRADGTMLFRAAEALGPYVEKTGDWLHHWAQAAPDRTFLAERSGAGWRAVHYASALQKVRAIGAALLARGLNADTPILVISGNGVDHACLPWPRNMWACPCVRWPSNMRWCRARKAGWNRRSS